MRKVFLFIFLSLTSIVYAERSPDELMSLSQEDSALSFAYCLGYYDSLTKETDNSDLIYFLDGKSKELGSSKLFSQMPVFSEGQRDGSSQDASVSTQLFCTRLIQETVQSLEENQEKPTDILTNKDINEERDNLSLSYCLGYYSTASGKGDSFSVLFDDDSQKKGLGTFTDKTDYQKGKEDANKEHNPNLLMQCMDKLNSYLDEIEEESNLRGV